MNSLLILHNMELIIDSYMNINSGEDLYPSFNAKQQPDISILEYLKRINSCSIDNFSTLILTFYIIQLYFDIVGIDQCTRFNIHRIILSAYMISLKFNEDTIYQQSHYAKILGVSVQELNYLEKYFLTIIEFNIPILSNAEYNDIINYLS